MALVGPLVAQGLVRKWFHNSRVGKWFREKILRKPDHPTVDTPVYRTKPKPEDNKKFGDNINNLMDNLFGTTNEEDKRKSTRITFIAVGGIVGIIILVLIIKK